MKEISKFGMIMRRMACVGIMCVFGLTQMGSRVHLWTRFGKCAIMTVFILAFVQYVGVFVAGGRKGVLVANMPPNRPHKNTVALSPPSKSVSPSENTKKDPGHQRNEGPSAHLSLPLVGS